MAHFPLCPESYDFCISLDKLKLKFVAINDLKVRRVELFLRYQDRDVRRSAKLVS